MTENAVQTYVYKVEMKCKNCVKKLTNALEALKGKGLEEYNVMFDAQQVEVKATLPGEQILEVMKSTGKEVTMVSSP